MELEGYYIETVAKRMKHAFSVYLKDKNAGITVDQWIILDTLLRGGEMPQVKLCNITHKDAPTITRILDLLGSKGLIHRKINTIDRRSFTIGLTDQGTKHTSSLLPVVKSFRNQCYNSLSTSELKSLKKILDKISTNLKS